MEKITNEKNDSRIYSFMLAMIPGVGDVTINSLLEVFGSAKNVFEANEKQLSEVRGITKKKIVSLNQIKESEKKTEEKIRLWEKAGIKAVFKNEAGYPKALSNLYDAPYVIFYKGALPFEAAPAVAIVGARACSDYGKNIAYGFGKQLALQGIQIISGMATGADLYGHKGALAGGGYTAGVLGCGVDICYPRTNYNTYYEMQKSGCVLSEVLPSTEPSPGLFPRRNRLIAALSDAVIIIEARERSGSLITADQALEQGKEVFAVPGRIGDPLSEGCLSLIKQGAYPLTNLNDILECESIKRKAERIKTASACNDNKTKKDTESFENGLDKKVFTALTDIPKNLNRIMYETALDYEAAAQAVISLELKGLVRSVSAGLYVRACI